MANTQRPPPPVLHPPAPSDELHALSEALDVVDRPSATIAQPAIRSILRGNDDEVLDLAALAKLGTSAPAPSVPTSAADSLHEPAGAQLQLDEKPVVPMRRTRPTWLVPLLIGIGFGAALNAFFFASSRGSDHRAVLSAQTASTSTIAQPAVPANVPAAAVPQPPPVPAHQVPAPSLTMAPVSSAAPSATETAKSTRIKAANAAVERSVTKSATSTAAPATTNAAAVAPRGPASASPIPAADAPSAGPPVLVVRPAASSDAASPATAPRSSSGAIDALLDDALSPQARRAELAAAEASPSAEMLPATPSPQDVASAMRSLQFAIRGCAMGQAGALTTALSVRSDGRVSSAQVIGAPFAGTPAGRCMEGVLRSARFPRFKQSTFNVQYALKID